MEEYAENTQPLNSLQTMFLQFLEQARNQKGFSLSLIDREEELTDAFVDTEEEDSEYDESSEEDDSSEDSEDSSSSEEEEE